MTNVIGTLSIRVKFFLKYAEKMEYSNLKIKYKAGHILHTIHKCEFKMD